MPITTNENVVNAMMNQRSARAGNLSTNGVSLYSYDLEIARWIGTELIVFDYTATGMCELFQRTMSCLLSLL